jgi:hypothetical protein
LSAAPAADAAEDPDPWRLSKALRLPEWLEISGQHRTRYETLDDTFRAGRSGGDQMLAFRTMLRADVKLNGAGVTGELIDARQALADEGSPIDTTMVNTVELLQAYLSLDLESVLPAAGTNQIRLGRQTLDVGSRRLVARSNFRNTISAFTGALWQWQITEGPLLRAFYFLPVTRQPRDAPSLLDNEVEFDDESFDRQFWGLHSEWTSLPWGATGEVYLFGLHEEDSDAETRNRQLYTPGLRLSRRPAKGAWDFDFETVVQLGESRATDAPDDMRDLDHFAHFHHAEVGYTLEHSWSPRVSLLYDYASGDDDPDDGQNNRFDTLYGDRTFEHGPSGIYGAFNRSNIQSPGYGLSIRPVSGIELRVTHRLYWLASSTDAWTTSGVRDPSGESGSFIGHQLEGRLRWEIVPDNVRVELGGAQLFAGRFMEEAPNSNGQGDCTYGYVALELRF